MFTFGAREVYMYIPESRDTELFTAENWRNIFHVMSVKHMCITVWDSSLPKLNVISGEKFVGVLICVSPRASRLSSEKGQI